MDGNASFNAWKTYRQLLYAGVMEVVKIKNEGYPFREKIDDFWSKRCVMNGYHKILRLDSSMDPREGCEAVANAVRVHTLFLTLVHSFACTLILFTHSITHSINQPTHFSHHTRRYFRNHINERTVSKCSIGR